MKRNGVFKSQTAGVINLNKELVEPLEKEFSAQWQRTMDAGTKQLLDDRQNGFPDREQMGIATTRSDNTLEIMPQRLEHKANAKLKFYHHFVRARSTGLPSLKSEDTAPS